MIPLVTHGLDLFAEDIDVVVEVLGGVEPARTLVTQALLQGIPVVTANKSLIAEHGDELRALAARQGTPLLFDAAVLAGVPFLGALARRPLFSSFSSLAGIINGTTPVITSAIARGESYADALRGAIDAGYAEPESGADTSGRDAAEKLAVLLQLAGCQGLSVAALPRVGIEALTFQHFEFARACGGTIKPVALASLDLANSGAWVGPAFVPADHPFATVSDVTNALAIRGPRRREALFVGPGAGPEVTAATIIDDIVECVRLKDADGACGPVRIPTAQTPSLTTPPASRWFVCITNRGSLSVSDVAEFVAAHRVPALHIEERAGGIAALLAYAPWQVARDAVDAINACGAHADLFPVLTSEAQS